MGEGWLTHLPNFLETSFNLKFLFETVIRRTKYLLAGLKKKSILQQEELRPVKLLLQFLLFILVSSSKFPAMQLVCFFF